jgi:mevalonate kinase
VSFQTRVPGKWVLAGEHSVLRGATAVALPHPEFALTLKYEPRRGEALRTQPAQAERAVRDLLVGLADSWEADGKSFPRLEGVLSIESDIPIGAGLGSSAALCVALTRWLSDPLKIRREEQFDFARQLEHHFHGRSSGMDVAVVSAGEPIAFGIERGARPLGVKKLPKFTFHDTGLRARTSECVYRVERLREEMPVQGVKADEVMGTASRLAMEGLSLFDRGASAEGIEQIARAMMQARECFYGWGLVPGEAKRIEDELLAQGAKAVKLTGAGGGGFVVALW